MRRLLLDNRRVDRALDLTWGLMLPAGVYWGAMIAFPAAPRVIVPFIACMVGAGAGSLVGAEKWWGGWLQRILALPISAIMLLFACIGTIMVVRDPYGMSIGMLIDVAASLLLLWWGSYLFVSAALRRRRMQAMTVTPQFLAPPR